MDKSWIDLSERASPIYIEGVEQFLNFAFANKGLDAKIYCPCRKCGNRYFVERVVAKEHIIVNGFLTKYKNWTNHGEPYVSPHVLTQQNENRSGQSTRDDMVEMVHEAIGIPMMSMNVEFDDDREKGPNDEFNNFFRLLEDAECALYPGCTRFTKLSFIVRLLHLKVLSGWTDKSVTMLLELLNEAFPEGVQLPKSYYDANKITADLGFTYNTWDACPNNCMLFKGDDEGRDACEICLSPRYKQFDGNPSQIGKKDTKMAAKQVRYFPLKPRLQRLFMSSKTAKLMRWHTEQRVDDGVQRHPADSCAWKTFDRKNPQFASDCRNVRLGLAADGFNPFRSMSIAHSTWPIVLIPYNLPPWMCMKQPYFMLSMLIDGPKGPGNKIDVYLQPLIEELKELWEEGVLTYDASENQMFQLHAALLWTISDFPAYANLSGWSTKGEFACPCCNDKTQSQWLVHGKKFCYMGHRRFLSRTHKFRKDKVSFNGQREYASRPPYLSGSDVLKQLNDMLTEYSKEDLKTRKREERNHVNAGKKKSGWKKKSIFFELPYWEHNLIRHNLDMMHIEKNVCDNILWTLLGVTGKSKDNLKARCDLQEMGIRKALHPQPKGSGKAYLPPSCFTMTKDDKDVFLKVLKSIKVPDGYASNITRCVHLKERTMWGLKSHDSHILMQQLLPLAIRRALPKNVVEPLIELSNFFRQLCSKVNKVIDLEHAQDRIILTLCHLEKIFPPVFFDIMEHLPIHLAEEAILAGAVQFRWMYPIERFLLTLKLYVRNRAHPEGSIAKGYLMEECMHFCSMYLDDVENKSNRPRRNDDDGNVFGRPIGKGVRTLFDRITLEQAHRYVLHNIDIVAPFRMKHKEYLRSQEPCIPVNQIDKVHMETFHIWLLDHVKNSNVGCEEEIQHLARGPDQFGWTYDGYIINGFRFRKLDKDNRRTTQNHGILVKANTSVGDITYYGRLTDVIKIRYTNDIQFVLFKCDWVDDKFGKMEDEFKLTLVNFSYLLYPQNRSIDEPFILATQAEQVCYVQDPLQPEWHVVMKMAVRDLFDMYSKDSSNNIRSVPQAEPFSRQQLDETIYMHDDDVCWVRKGIDGTTVDDMQLGDKDIEMDIEMNEIE